MSRSLVSLIAVVAMFALAGCETAPPDAPKVNITFSGKDKIAVPASQVEFVDSYRPTLRAPNVEHTHEFRPAHLVRLWLNERLATSPSEPGKLIVEITQASVTEEALETEKGVRGAIKQEPERKLTGTLKWEIRYEGPEVRWKTSAYAEASRMIPEYASLNQADKIYNDVIEALGDHLDRRIEEQVGKLRATLQSKRVPE